MSELQLVLLADPSGLGPLVVTERTTEHVKLDVTQLLVVRDTAPAPITVLAEAIRALAVVQPEAIPQVVQAGFPGPRGQGGPPGPPAAAISVIAAVDLSYPRVVAVSAGQAYYPDLTLPSDVQRVLGVTLQSAPAGAIVQVARTATFHEPLWSWQPGPLYCDLANGTMTQNAPATGAVLEVGTAIDAQTIAIHIHRAILR